MCLAKTLWVVFLGCSGFVMSGRDDGTSVDHPPLSGQENKGLLGALYKM
jgi:hypothetical protein